MLRTKINFKCELPECDGDNFYVMPVDEKVKSGDTVSSLNKFVVQCKKCRKKYLLKLTIKRI